MRTECFFHFTGFLVKGNTKEAIDMTYKIVNFLQIKGSFNIQTGMGGQVVSKMFMFLM